MLSRNPVFNLLEMDVFNQTRANIVQDLLREDLRLLKHGGKLIVFHTPCLGKDKKAQEEFGQLLERFAEGTGYGVQKYVISHHKYLFGEIPVFPSSRYAKAFVLTKH